MGIFNEQIKTDKISTNVQGQQGPPGPQGIGFKLDRNNNYDMQNKKLVNVDSGTNAEDAINNSQLDTKTILLQNASPGTVVNNKAVIYSDTGSVHTKSVYFEDIPGPGDDGLSNQMRLLTPHQSFNNIHLNIPDLKNYDGNGGRMSSEMMVTSVDQTVTGKKVFRNIEVPNPTSNNQAANKYYVDHNFLNRLTGGQIGGDLDMRGNTIKYLKFDNTDSAAARVAELKKKVDLSGSTMTGNLNMGNKQITNLGYSISDPTDVINLGFSDQKYLQKVSDSDLDLDDHRVKNSLEPVNSRDLTTKNYVDTEIAKIPQSSGVDTSSFLKLDGSREMIGDLDMDSNFIRNVGIDLADSTSAMPKAYIDAISQNVISYPITADIDLSNYKITNLKTPTGDNDAVNKFYIDDTLAKSHLVASSKKNEFVYLDNPDDTSSEYNIVVNSYTNFNSSPHRNKKAYSITLQKDAGTNNYRSRIGFNLFPLPLGTYTMIFEFYPPEMTNIQLSCQATSAYIHKQVQKDFTDYSKLLVQINNNSKNTPDYIYLTMHGTSTAPANAHLIVYGIKDWSDSISPLLYDHTLTDEMFEYNDGDMKMNTDLDINNHHIIHLNDGTDESGAVNKKQLDIVDTKLNKTARSMKNYWYSSVFGANFYDLIETGHFNLSQTASGIVIDGILPNFNLGTKRFIRDYSNKNGMILSAASHIKTPKIMNQNSSFTFLISFFHNPSKNCEIYFSNVSTGVKYHPYYKITSDKIIIDTGTTTHETSFTSNFRYKKLFIWICFDGGNNLYKMALSNYSAHVSETFNPPTNFLTDQLEINFGVFVNKIAFIDKFIDVNSIQHHYIQLVEKRNGSYLER